MHFRFQKRFRFFHNNVYQFTFIHYSLNIFLPTIKSDHQDKLIFTFRLWSFIVKLAEELFIFHEVELIPRIQFPATNYACKTVHMVNIVLGSSYYIWRWNMWPTGSTFGTKFSVRKEAKNLEMWTRFCFTFYHFTWRNLLYKILRCLWQNICLWGFRCNGHISDIWNANCCLILSG